jgi:hypothetical protein
MTMIDLFAVEPTAFEDCKDLKLLLGQVGFHRGRMIARCPKQWIRSVLESVSGSRRTEFVEILRKHEKDFVKIGSTLDQSKSWLDNARHLKRQKIICDAIVARGSDAEFPDLDVDDEYFESFGGSARNVLSSPDGYAEASSFLLQKSKYGIAIFDPLIGLLESRWKKVLERMADVAMSGTCRKFNVFTLLRKDCIEQIERGAPQFFSNVCKAGVSVNYTVLRDIGSPDADDHARYLISYLGAMQFDRGFDAEEPPRERKVSLLPPALANSLARQFLDGDLPFERVLTLSFPASIDDESSFGGTR